MGDTGATGAKGDKGDPGSGGLSSSDFTMQGVINMNSNKVINLPDPQRDNEPVTKRYADTNYLTDSGFVMSDSISMNNHEIIGLNPTPSTGTAAVSKNYADGRYIRKGLDINMNNYKVIGLGTPTNNTDAATKKYVDDKRCTFKGGTTSISMVDLRDTGLGGTVELYNNITFDGGAYCPDFGSSSVGKAIVNKNTLQTGQLITQQSLSPALSRPFQSAVKKELLMLKGKPTSYTIIYKDRSVNGNPSFTVDSSSVTFDKRYLQVYV